MGPWAVVLMGVVSIACACSAIGLWSGRRWGRLLAMTVLTVNALGDLTNAVARHDARTLIGLPVAGILIGYLASRRVARFFPSPGSSRG